MFTLGAAPLSADPGTVVAVGQPPFEAERFTAGEGKFLFSSGGASKSVDAQNLVRWGALAQSRQGNLIVLADGSLLVADLVKSDDENLTVDSYLLGEIELPLESVAGVLLNPPADPERRDELEFRIRDAKGDNDRLILDNGDELTGTIVALDDAQAQLESNVGKVKIELDRASAIVLNPTLRAASLARGPTIIAGLSDGSWLLASQVRTVDGKAELDLLAGPKLTTDVERVVALQPLGGRVAYLSDLKPSGYRHVPFLQLPWQWKADRNVLGRRLRSGGQMYLKGLGMHSASRLSFPLDGSHRRFEAALAIDDQTAGRGSVVFRVFLDTDQVYASPVVRGGDEPLPISVDLPANARTLSLLVDFADRGDEQDHANWLDARLVE